MADEIVWKPDYDTGNPLVDREHRQLIQLVNLLSAANGSEYSHTALEDAFGALKRYVRKHFKDEEDLLEAVESPYLEQQRLQHENLSRELRELWSLDRGLSRERVVDELVKWAEFRLLKHFLSTDFDTFHDFPFMEAGDDQAGDEEGVQAD